MRRRNRGFPKSNCDRPLINSEGISTHRRGIGKMIQQISIWSSGVARSDSEMQRPKYSGRIFGTNWKNALLPLLSSPSPNTKMRSGTLMPSVCSLDGTLIPSFSSRSISILASLPYSVYSMSSHLFSGGTRFHIWEDGDDSGGSDAICGTRCLVHRGNHEEDRQFRSEWDGRW